MELSPFICIKGIIIRSSTKGGAPTASPLRYSLTGICRAAAVLVAPSMVPSGMEKSSSRSVGTADRASPPIRLLENALFVVSRSSLPMLFPQSQVSPINSLSIPASVRIRQK